MYIMCSLYVECVLSAWLACVHVYLDAGMDLLYVSCLGFSNVYVHSLSVSLSFLSLSLSLSLSLTGLLQHAKTAMQVAASTSPALSPQVLYYMGRVAGAFVSLFVLSTIRLFYLSCACPHKSFTTWAEWQVLLSIYLF